mgnify:CR=1 FL=1
MTALILILTATSTALIAGLFYSYSCSVNPGLGKLPDEGYLAAMQSINREILNPVFFATFMGTLILLPVSTWLQYSAGASKSFLFLLAATLIYAVGVFGVTMFGNVPLNDALDKFNLHSASMEEIKSQRSMFEVPWNKLHNIRTIANIVSLVLVVIACLYANYQKQDLVE